MPISNHFQWSFAIFALFCNMSHYFSLIYSPVHYFALWHIFVALWWHPILHPPNVTKLESMTIIICLGGKYAISYYIIGLVGAAISLQNPAYNEAAYMQTSFYTATDYCNFLPKNYFYIEWIHQLAHNSCIYRELAKHCCALSIY